MKVCNRCKETKSLDEFGKKGNGIQPYCRPCNKNHSKEYYAKNKEKQKKQIYASRKIRIENTKKYIRELKESTPCKDCSKKYPYYVMDFDHQHSKEFLISKATDEGISLEKIKKEIDKCEIVCANCHRIRTFNNPR